MNIRQKTRKHHTKRAKDLVLQIRNKYNIHNRAFTKDDFLRICKFEKIYLLGWKNKQLIEPLLKFKWMLGYYVTRKGRSFIYVRSMFLPKFDLYTAFHELGHHFFSHCDAAKYKQNSRSLLEFEADMFASNCLREVSK